MSVLMLLVPLSVCIAGCFLAAFFWAVRTGQYEDTCTPAMRILTDDPPARPGRSIAKPVEVLPSPGEPLMPRPNEAQAALDTSLRTSSAKPL
jgi:cbb3-type cytochrome oxidase maturation protein